MLSRRQLVVGGVTTIGAAVTAGSLLGKSLVEGELQNSDVTEVQNPKGMPQIYKNPGLGIECTLRKNVTLMAFDLRPGVTANDMLRWMTLVTDTSQSLIEGKPISGDPEPELAAGDGNLALSVGFGPSLFKRLGLVSRMPTGFGKLPSFKIDRFSGDYSDGDVLLQVQGNLPLQVTHAVRVLLRDSSDFATLKWQQEGFTQQVREGTSTKVHRNLMGQVDGTDNPEIGTPDFSGVVWIEAGPEWAIGGTQLVIRRIRMNLDTWDSLATRQKELTIGRSLDNGAPLSGRHLSDPVDLNARDASGLVAIPDYAHIRRASAQNLDERFYRRPYNYTEPGGKGRYPESGMIWMAYARDLSKQYVPVQTRLAEYDLLNIWTQPVGSAVFAIAPVPATGSVFAAALFR